jgi:hypothetical protein
MENHLFYSSLLLLAVAILLRVMFKKAVNEAELKGYSKGNIDCKKQQNSLLIGLLGHDVPIKGRKEMTISVAFIDGEFLHFTKVENKSE